MREGMNSFTDKEKKKIRHTWIKFQRPNKLLSGRKVLKEMNSTKKEGWSRKL